MSSAALPSRSLQATGHAGHELEPPVEVLPRGPDDPYTPSSTQSHDRASLAGRRAAGEARGHDRPLHDRPSAHPTPPHWNSLPHDPWARFRGPAVGSGSRVRGATGPCNGRRERAGGVVATCSSKAPTSWICPVTSPGIHAHPSSWPAGRTFTTLHLATFLATNSMADPWRSQQQPATTCACINGSPVERLVRWSSLCRCTVPGRSTVASRPSRTIRRAGPRLALPDLEGPGERTAILPCRWAAFVHARFQNVYGRLGLGADVARGGGNRLAHVAPTSLRALVGRPLVLENGLRRRAIFIYVDDIVDGCCVRVRGQTVAYNLARGRDHDPRAGERSSPACRGRRNRVAPRRTWTKGLASAAR